MPTLTHAELLATAELFAPLDRLGLARLASCVEPLAVKAGHEVVRQGEEGDDLFIVVGGTFGVFARSARDADEARLGTLWRGDCFGEMALLTGASRNATVRADTDGELLRLERHRFLELVGREPEVGLAVAATLSRRLHRADEALLAQDRLLTGQPDEVSRSEQARAVRRRRRPREPLLASIDRSDDDAQAGAQAVVSWHAPSRLRPLLASGLSALLVLAGMLGVGGPQGAFILFLAAGIVLWVGDVAAAGVIGLGMVALWVLAGIATPSEAVAGFGSMGWLFAVAIFGLAAAASRAGLLLRIGLLIMQRVPRTLFGIAGALLATGVVLSPVMPMGIGRAALTAPLALAAADAMRLRNREPAAAVLGLAAWIGAGPLLFLFLNASPVCLLAWGLLPDASRLRFDWIHWLLAALPLGLFAGVGALVSLYLVLRPDRGISFPPERLDLQLAVLGPPSNRELTMVAILALTVAGWAVAPALGVEAGIVAILGLLGAVLSRNFDQRSLRELDWDYLIFYGVALSLGHVMASLGLDRLVADAVGEQVLGFGLGPLLFVFTVACLTVLVRLVLLPEPAILLLCLMVIPVAPTVGVDPWVAILTVLATAFFWFVPSQTPSYLVSHSASEGRLFSHAQARRVSFAYAAVTLAGLALSLPYWHMLGLL